MDRLIHTALSGMRASMDSQRVIASNMANANTLGFRAEMLDQRAVTIEGQPNEARAMQRASVRGADMAAGETIATGRDLDVAVETNALIAVQAVDGTEAYTRRGDLSVSATGLLVNGEGRPVLGDNGPITVPPVGIPGIAPDGSITIADPAAPDQPPAEIGRIKLAAWEGSPISKGLDGLFRVEGGGILPTDEAATVKVGSLEQSNVKTTEVLVDMIDAQRLFAMRSKVISTAREIDESGAQLMRLG
jgi:flagellar basal-body rod protein FlgF